MMTNRNRESMDNTNLVFSTQTKTSACHYLYLYGLKMKNTHLLLLSLVIYTRIKLMTT